MQQVQSREWRRFGFGGPPEPWERDASRDLDRLASDPPGLHEMAEQHERLG